MRISRRIRAGVSVMSAVLLAGLLTACGTQPSPATRGGDSRTVAPVPIDFLTPLAGRVLEPPAPVTGADGVEHIAYELLLTNPYSLYVTVQRVEILDDRGRVNRVIEGAQVPELLTVFAGAAPARFGPGQAGGNFIVQDIGDGNYAFYAHLQPGSLQFEVGDRIRKGEVLGLLGNTGNSDAPHLHFHIMDGPGPLSSNGVPYEFDRFIGEGVVTNPAEVATGGVADIDTSTLTGRTRRAPPLDKQVVTFGE